MKNNSSQKVSYSNDQTIKAYEYCVDEYLSKTESNIQSHDSALVEWINKSLTYISHDDKILEIGSGTGRDANYIESLGFHVQRSDATKSFIKFMNSQEKSVLQLNVIEDPIPSGYNMLYANAVFPHFTKHEAETVLKKTYHALPSGGVFALSVKLGKGEEWVLEKISKRRFIHYWSKKELFSILTSLSFQIVFHNTNTGVHYNHSWLNVIVKK